MVPDDKERLMADPVNAELKRRFPSMAKQLTVGHPEIPQDDPMLGAFVQAAEEAGLDVRTANKFLARYLEATKALQKK